MTARLRDLPSVDRLAGALGAPHPLAVAAARATLDERRAELRGRRVSVIDVPGHERLVRTMVAGATGIDEEVTIAGLRDELGTSRKYAQALLEQLDAERVTLRVGDRRVLRRRR